MNCTIDAAQDTRPYSFYIKKNDIPVLHLAADTADSARNWISLLLQKINQTQKVKKISRNNYS